MSVFCNTENCTWAWYYIYDCVCKFNMKTNYYTVVIAVPSKKQFETSHVKPRDIKNLLHNKKSTSAPGEDKITYGILTKLSSTHHFLATVFSKLLLTNDPPDMWSSSKVILIHKKGDTNEPGNFRMIALTSCVGKLYHQLLANRIIDFLHYQQIARPRHAKGVHSKSQWLCGSRLRVTGSYCSLSTKEKDAPLYII